MSAEELLDKIMHGEVVTVKGHTLLTGAQWYDRFLKEYRALSLKAYSKDQYAKMAAKRATEL